jgi:uncharacterized protein
MHETPPARDPNFDARRIERPCDALLTYYLVCSLAALVLAPLVFLPMYFKFITLRYRFDDEGVSMSHGILWRQEVNLAYRRIQDIHVTRNIIQRWFGLATVSVQTASGNATPELQIEGVLEYDALRDFLYAKMRGARGIDAPPAIAASHAVTMANASGVDAGVDEPAMLLRQIATDLAAVRQAIESRGQGGAS